MMSMVDEEEYVDFYDFSKIYENHPLLIKDDTEEGNKDQSTKKKEKDVDIVDIDDEDENEDWEDCDMESINSIELEEELKDEVPDVKEENKNEENSEGESESF